MIWEIRYYKNEINYKSKIHDFVETSTGKKEHVIKSAKEKIASHNYEIYELVHIKAELYNVKVENGDRFILRAYILSSGELQLEGQDFCELAEELYGDEEYEYYYLFDLQNTNKLKSILGANDLIDSLVEFYKDEKSSEKLFKLCDDNEIKYKIHVI